MLSISRWGSVMKKIPNLRHLAGVEKWFATPFTVVDARRSVWNVVTDRAWIVAVRGKGQYPRWPGDMAHLNVMLSLLQAIPVEPRVVDTEVLRNWAMAREGFGSVLGITVDLKRLEKPLGIVHKKYVQIWDASSVMRQTPCLAVTSMDVRMFLMGCVQDASHVFDTVKLTRVSGPKPEKPTPEEWSGFDLAMSLDED